MNGNQVGGIRPKKPARRIIDIFLKLAVLVVILAVLAGILYGVHNLSKTSSKSTVTHQPKTSQHPKKQQSVTQAAPKTNQISATSSPQLANSGPGISEFVVFMAATIFGTISYYAYKRLKLAGKFKK